MSHHYEENNKGPTAMNTDTDHPSHHVIGSPMGEFCDLCGEAYSLDQPCPMATPEARADKAWEEYDAICKAAPARHAVIETEVNQALLKWARLYAEVRKSKKP